ncbi:MAG: hypothetical protein RR379_10540 [Clostridia bacterium]
MQIILDGLVKLEHAVLALGMFDGVHIGHRVLLKKAKAIAVRRGVPLVACTFVNHPMQLIAPAKCPPMLSTFDERAELLAELGVDMLYAMPFDKRVMNELPECYVGELVRRFHPTDVVCGYNHSYGKQGKGTPALLMALGAALHFQTVIVPKITLEGAEVSSSVVRSLLACGNVARACEMLGRPYERIATAEKVQGDGCELVFAPNGKQAVAEGTYRVLGSWAGQTIPCTLRMENAQRGSCWPVGAVLPRDEVKIQYLARRK